jgi:hypothetical protein
MTETDVHLCETGCTRPAPSTFICWHCVDHITGALASITAHDWLVLERIARRQEQPFTNRAAPGGGHTAAGPSEPINTAALGLLQDLTRWDAVPAADWAGTPDAAHWHHHVPTRVAQALVMVHGEDEKTTTPEQVTERIAHEDRAMPPPALVDYLGGLGFVVTRTQLTTWANRGRITRRDAGGAGSAAWYKPSDVLACLYPATTPVDTDEQAA